MQHLHSSSSSRSSTLSVLFMSLGVVFSYPSGPAETECGAMAPHLGLHGPMQTSASPFILTVSQNTYTSGDTITVTISANDGGMLKGFYVQARPLHMGMVSGDAIGTFTASTGQKLINCFRKNDNSISHNEASAKNQVTLNWQPLPTDQHDFVFQASVVRHRTSYWLNIQSTNITKKMAATSDSGMVSMASTMDMMHMMNETEMTSTASTMDMMHMMNETEMTFMASTMDMMYMMNETEMTSMASTMDMIHMMNETEMTSTASTMDMIHMMNETEMNSLTSTMDMMHMMNSSSTAKSSSMLSLSTSMQSSPTTAPWREPSLAVVAQHFSATVLTLIPFVVCIYMS